MAESCGEADTGNGSRYLVEDVYAAEKGDDGDDEDEERKGMKVGGWRSGSLKKKIKSYICGLHESKHLNSARATQKLLNGDYHLLRHSPRAPLDHGYYAPKFDMCPPALAIAAPESGPSPLSLTPPSLSTRGTSGIALKCRFRRLRVDQQMVPVDQGIDEILNGGQKLLGR
ncbi:hypothetical protein RUND412_004648 [Rhizina undulata]